MITQYRLREPMYYDTSYVSFDPNVSTADRYDISNNDALEKIRLCNRDVAEINQKITDLMFDLECKYRTICYFVNKLERPFSPYEKVDDIKNDYEENGFSSQRVKDIVKNVRNIFFYDECDEYRSFNCFYVTSTAENSCTYVITYFRNPKDNFTFSIEIPVNVNSYYSQDKIGVYNGEYKISTFDVQENSEGTLNYGTRKTISTSFSLVEMKRELRKLLENKYGKILTQSYKIEEVK